MSAETRAGSSRQSAATSPLPPVATSSTSSSTYGGTNSSTSSRRRPPHGRVKLTTNIQFDANRDAFKDIRRLLELFQEHDIPGPLLLRTTNDFSLKIGSGGQGQVRAASQEYVSALDTLKPSGFSTPENAQQTWIWPNYSVQAKCVSHWRNCVIKQLRSKDRKLEHEAASAVREVLGLCRAAELSKRSDYIVRLLGWGICLDALESGDLSHSRLPFLVLERATCDMEQFIARGFHRREDVATKMNIGLEVGIGLFAVHTANMTHGDMKLSNILVFPDDRKGWSVKLCDFGSANETTEGGQGQYSGTDTWRSPETLSSTTPVDLQLCDIFAYGLVLWSWLTGLTISPIHHHDLEAGQILKNLGQQQFFHLALPDIVKEFGEPSDTKWLENESVYSGRNAVPDAARVRRIWLPVLGEIELPTIFGPPLNSQPRVFESQTVIRILNTLSAALDELPNRRSREPWQLLRSRESQELSQSRTETLRPPKRFSRSNKTTEADQVDPADRGSSSEIVSNPKKSVVHHGRRFLQRFTNRLSFHLGSYILIIAKNRRRLAIFQQFHRVFFDILGKDADKIFLIKHSEHTLCEHLDQSSLNLLEQLLFPSRIESTVEQYLRKLVYLTSGRTDLPHIWQGDEHCLYALARIRSRFPDDTCWKQLFVLNPGLGVEIDQRIADLRISNTASSLAWAFRHQTALDIPESEHESYFTFLDDRYVSDSSRTFRLHLLFERGFFLGQTFGDSPDAPSIFLRYLNSLRYPSSADVICQQFRRVSSLDGAIDLSKFYYTGLSDPSDAQTKICRYNTCLHDAVRALSPFVVKYLIATDFEVDARDENGMTALDVLRGIDALPPGYLRDHIPRKEWHVQLTTRVATIESLIIDSPRHKRRERDLPLGWKTWQTSAKPAYIETSTALDADVAPFAQRAYPYPITFKKPSTGLYQNNVIALVKRQLSKTEDESYLLNPVRFLRMQAQTGKRIEPAKTARFNEAWYEDDVMKLHQPFEEVHRVANASMLRRSFHNLGYERTPLLSAFSEPEPSSMSKALAWHHVETFGKLLFSGDLLIVVFGPLSFAARYQHWNALAQFLLSGFALAGIHARIWHVLDYVPPESLGRYSFARPWLRYGTGQLDQLYNFGTLLLDLVIASLFSHRLDSHCTHAFLVGNILLSNLLTLGFGALWAGVRHRRSIFNPTSGESLINCISFSVFVAGVTYALRLHDASELLVSQALIAISRTAAMISIVIFIVFFLFVTKTHSMLFDDSEYAEDISQLREGRELEDTGPVDSLTKVSVYSLILFLFGAVIGDNAVTSIAVLIDEHPIKPVLAIAVLLPIISKCTIIFKIIDFGTINQFQSVITRTTGLSLGHILVILPLLIIVGWCRGQGVSYDFTAGQIVFLFLQWQLVTMTFYDGLSYYFRGLELIGLYIIFVIYTLLTPEP